MRYGHFIMSLVIGYILLGVVSEGWAISGNDWLASSDSGRMYYIMGVVEGWQGFLVSYEHFGDKTMAAYVTYKEINTCIKPMTFGQMKAIAEKYLKENPNEWHSRMESLTFLALYAACPKDEK